MPNPRTGHRKPDNHIVAVRPRAPVNWFRDLGATRQGIVLMVLAMVTLTLMDSIAKSLTARYNPMQVVWARYACSSLVVALVLAPRLRTLLPTRHLKLQLARSAFLFGATFCFFSGMPYIRLADLVAIFEVNPLIVTILAFFILKEPAGLRRMLGVIFGLVGALIIIRPGSAMFSPYSVLPLMGACSYATYVILTRFLGRDEHILTSLIYTMLFGTIAASILVVPVWVNPTLTDSALMLLIGAIGVVGQYFLIRAFTIAEAGAIAPFSYVGLIFAVLFGYFIFGELPDLVTVFGALVIVGSGIYVWHRETRISGADGHTHGETR